MRIAPYGGWNRCLFLEDSGLQLVATLEVGPRIIRFGEVDGDNEFVEYPDQMGKTGGEEYRSYGGHRLWIAPEVKGRTDLPDNEPVELSEDDGFHVLTARVEKSTNLQREMRVRLREGAVTVSHRIYNRGRYGVHLAPWAITVMAAGGVGVFPQHEYISHSERLLPAANIALWGYTNMSDHRWAWGQRLVRLRQTPDKSYQKAGAFAAQGWIAYANRGNVFVKTFDADVSAEYPDLGCNCEMFTRNDMLEIESLGPLANVEPGAFVQHDENWLLARDIELPDDDEEALGLINNLVSKLR